MRVVGVSPARQLRGYTLGDVSSSLSSAVETVAAVHSGDHTAAAAVDAALARLEAAEPRINAFTSVQAEQARAAAAQIDALSPDERARLPLAGVPFAVKDSIPVGSPVVTRLTDAGGVVIGRTTIPELCVWGVTDSAENGITRNPWDTGVSPGGSSGGSAAAVAAGVVPFALGSDGMGSLRIPAACCGLVTLKPGPGVVPLADGEDDWGGMSVQGALATTVADVALVTALLSGDDPGFAEVGRTPEVGYSTASPVALGPLNLVPIRFPWRDAATTAVESLRMAGIAVHNAGIPAPGNPFLLLARWTSGVERAARSANRPISSLERRNKYHALLGRTIFRRGGAADGSTRFNRGAERLRADVEKLMTSRGLDVLLTPSLADFPPAATDWHLRSWARTLWANMRFSPFASQWNVLGWPAMTVPVGTAKGPNGRDLPVAIQLVARPGAESTLLEIAAAMESRNPWQRNAEPAR